MVNLGDDTDELGRGAKGGWRDFSWVCKELLDQRFEDVGELGGRALTIKCGATGEIARAAVELIQFRPALRGGWALVK